MNILGEVMKNKEVFSTFHLMDTIVSVKLIGKKVKRTLKKIQTELTKFARLYSRFNEKGVVVKINEKAGVSSVKVDQKLLTLIQKAVEFGKLSNGLFDVTVGPLLDLWSVKSSSSPPSDGLIQKTKELVDYQDIFIDDKKRLIMLKRINQKLDLGGIAKGLATDECNKIIRKHNINQGYVNIGGNVSVIGSNPSGQPWKVGIKHPRKTDHLIGLVKTVNKTVVTSGDYERYFDYQGMRYHHLLNPLTGYPGREGLISVTVIAQEGYLADALSTAVFLSGMEKGRSLLKQFPKIEAVLIDDSENIYITTGLIDCFEVFGQTKITII